MAFNGKAIYQPKGRAGEYSAWACNFYTGCSNDCQYCYCKRGVMSHVWDTKPHLKKCFRNEEHALRTFVDEATKNLAELQQHGIFFSFTTDPMLPETMTLTSCAVAACMELDIPVKILTKRADWLLELSCDPDKARKLLAFGFTLTGHDELEPHASTNMERVRKMLNLHKDGYKTFASIEPVIDVPTSYAMINAISGWCELIKVGLLSGGKRTYKEGEVEFLYEMIWGDTRGSKFYIKDSVVKYLELDRATFPDHLVDSNYNIFA